MNRYPITSARIRPLQERPGPFLSDANRDVLRKELIGPTTAERAANRQARIGQIADPTAVAGYIDSGRATGGRVNPTAENQGDIFTTNWVYDPESGTRRQAQGWFAPWEIEDNQGNPVYDESSPEWQKAAQMRLEVRANNQVAQNRQSEQDYQREVVPSQTANRLAAGLQTAGIGVAAGALNNAEFREGLYNSRGNLPGYVGSINATRNRPQYGETEGDGGYDPRQRRYAGATAGPGGVVESSISYPQADMDRFDVGRPGQDSSPPTLRLPRDPSEEGPFSTGGEYRYLSGRGPRASLTNYSARIRPRY